MAKAAMVIGAVACLVGAYVWFLSAKWGYPFRISGAYVSYLEGGLFPGSGISVSADGSRFAYASTRTGAGDIYSSSLDGSNIVRLTKDRDYEGNPSYSPDGRLIAFERELNNCSHIWLMCADGTRERQLTHGGPSDSRPVFAPDGKHVWFIRTYQGSHVAHNYEASLDGADVHEVVTPTGEQLCTATYSKVGQMYFQVGSDQIIATDRSRTHGHVIGSGFRPALSPDGRLLAFLDNYELWLMNSDGTQRRRLFRSAVGLVEHIVFTPDSHHVLFVEQGAPAVGIGSNRECIIAQIGIDGSGYHVVVTPEDGG